MASRHSHLTAPPEHGPRADQLRTRINEVLEFALGNLQLIDDYSEHWEDEDGAIVRTEDKIAIETSMLLLVLDRAGGGQDRAVWDGLVEFCESRCRSPRVRCVIARHPRAVSSLGLGHYFLSALGRPDEDMDELVRNAVATGHAGTEELVPFRHLEFCWAQRKAGRGSSEQLGQVSPAWQVEASAIASDHDGLYTTREDCYALTHTLMYATDFGSDRIPGADEDRLRSSIGSALCFAVAIRDFDLLGELLLADAVLPGNASAFACCGWALRTRVLDSRGSLPGPAFRVDEYRRRGALGRASYAFQHSYHPAYVDALLCATLLRRQDEWPESDPHGRAAHDPGTLRRIVDLAWPDPSSPGKETALELCALPIPLADRVETLIEVAAIEIVRHYDLLALRQLLREVHGSPLERSRGVQVGARFLSNQIALSRQLEPPPARPGINEPVRSAHYSG
ncbi:DUF6895 family protein [Kitasatospora sp. NPDC085464]|uniref:DUF6895 family protein n=1 Tax=Kitasatospora sp. NPDC085464 TaxID=3364063 RepID=UPI0037C7255F